MTFLTMEMDILGPFLKASRRTQLVLLVVEYFTKWVEVEALVKITISKIIFFLFLWKNIIYRFGLPRMLIIDNDM
jgi:hypothetical protein